MTPGPAPKPDDERIRRNAPIYEKVPVSWDGEIRGPELPEIQIPCECGGAGNGPHPDLLPGPCRQLVTKEWHPRTREWWEMWRTSAQAMVMHATDWEIMLDTAYLHNMFYSGYTTASMGSLNALAQEIRKRQEPYGATWVDRRKLRLEVKTPQTASDEEAKIAAEAAVAVDYLERLNKAVAEEKEK